MLGGSVAPPKSVSEGEDNRDPEKTIGGSLEMGASDPDTKDAVAAHLQQDP